MSRPAAAALVAATCLHLGFQLTVTVVVYPALLRASDWSRSHAEHTRRITPLVAVVYGSLVVAGVWALVASRSAATWVAVGGAAVAVLATALVAGPAHGRLSAGKDDRVVRRLLAADRVRTAAAVVAAVGALSGLLR